MAAGLYGLARGFSNDAGTVVEVRVLVLGAALLALPALAAASTTRPTVRVAATAPVRVVGSHWRAREHVRVVVQTANGPVTRHAVATTGGGFTVTFANVSVDVCGMGLEIVATGAGDRAVVKTVPRECPPSP